MTKKEIIEIVIKHASNINLEIDNKTEMSCYDKQEKKLRDGSTKNVYLVSFHTPDSIERNQQGEITSLIEGNLCFCCVDADNYDVLYYTKPQGYIEPDGTGHWT